MINYSSYFNTIFLGSLKPIFDKKWQEKGWGGKDDPAKYVGYDEIVMGFMEAAEVVLQSPSQYHLSKNQEAKLKKFVEILDEYDESANRPDEEENIIHDPLWHEIQLYAKELYDDLKNVN